MTTSGESALPSGKAHRSRGQVSVAAAFFLMVTAQLSWPLFARMMSGLNPSADPLLNHWALAWNFHVLARSPFTLFDANIFFPRPDTLAYSEHLFGVALLAWPAYLASGSTVFAYNCAVAASFVLSGLGMYLLVAELTGSRWAALFSGLVYSAAPYRFLHLVHLQLLSAQWFPFVFLYLYRFLRQGKRRQAGGAAFFALLQALSCNYYALYLGLALSLFCVLLAGFSLQRPLLDGRKAVLLAAAFAMACLLTVPFALPYERIRSEQGFYRRYQDVVHFSAEPLDYLRPSSFNKAFYVDYLPRQVRSEKALFPGLAAFLFAVVGVFATRTAQGPERPPAAKRLMWSFFAALVALGFLLSLGPELKIGEHSYTLPYRALYRYVPGFEGLRVPARLAILVLLGLAALSGRGVSRLLEARGRLRPWLGAAAVSFALLEYQTYSLARILPPAPAVPAVYHWLAEQPGDFGILELPIQEDITREAIRMYYSTVHWKRLANGFSGWWPNDYWILVGRMRHFPTARILRFLEQEVPVRYILIHYDQFPAERRGTLEEDMARYRERLPLRARFGSDSVHELLPSDGRQRTGPDGSRQP